jgi:acetolactate decarboxylase
MADLTASVDAVRPSENQFVGIRVEGRFAMLALRAACAAAPGEDLLEATTHQSEFNLIDEVGTLVGFWAPLYARAVNVPGYHFHFISQDRSLGGHVLGMDAGPLEVGVHIESELHVAIPETEEFLAADLSGDHQDALHRAETAGHGTPAGG